MMNPSKIVHAPVPRLEDDIAIIEEFDRYRETADRLRRKGIESLCRVVSGKAGAEENRWISLDEEPDDLIHPALVRIAATREFVRTTDAREHAETVSTKIRDTLCNARITNFFRPEEPQSPSAEAINSTFDSCVPVFQAARVLRASLASPNTVFSRPAALAYYRIVRELASVEEGNWIFGGARATEGGTSSAFMTGECARAISALSRALSKSSTVISVVEKLYRDWITLESLRTFPYKIENLDSASASKSVEYLPKKWLKAESNRLAFCAYNEIAAAAAQAGIVLEPEHYATLCNTADDSSIPAFCRVFATQFMEAAGQAAGCIRSVISEIQKYHKKELVKATKDKVKKARLKFGHALALDCIEQAHEHTKRAIEAAKELQVYVLTTNPDPDAPLNSINEFTQGLAHEVDRTRALLATTTVYLESVLDREIEREASGQFNAGELVSAAASYAELERPELDRRLERATEILCKSIAMDGTFATSTAIDTNLHGYTAVIIGSELLRAFAQLLQRSRFEVEPETIKRILSYFERTAVRTPDGSIVGWTGDNPRYPILASRWTSALAILALDRITRMLDDRINRSVFRHFSVKQPGDLAGKPRLDQLFYSDYGIATHSTFDGHDERHSGSVAYLLERMRSHILGLAPPPGSEEHCYSLLLFGPPGTGKTQLVESLATSVETSFVEITPSDFLVEGEAYLERQARNVFKCLSYLTRTVILFDEFDPMIRARKFGPHNSKLDAFAFLTPGMLPKLKLLNERAKRRQLAYCLITNRVGELEEAAIRTGRFDFKIGVYPPDLLSRLGRLIWVVAESCRNNKTQLPPDYLARLMHVLRASAGKGMTILGRQGNFTAPRKMIDQLNPDQVVKYLLEPTVTAEQPNLGKADANFPKRIPRTRSREHSIEVEQWLWVRIWDKAYEEMCQCNSSSELKSSSGLATLLDRWTTSYKVLHDEPTDHEIEDELKKTSISGRRRVRNVHMSRKHLKLQDRGELPDRPK